MSDHAQHISNLAYELSTAVNSVNGDVSSNEATRIKALGAARKLTAALEKPDALAFSHAYATNLTMCTRVAIDLDLFNMLLSHGGRNKTAKEMAAISGGEQLLIVRILRILVCLGYVDEVGEETYAPTAVCHVFANKRRVAMTKHAYAVGLPAASKVPEYFRKYGYKSPFSDPSRPSPFQYGHQSDHSFFEWLRAHPEWNSNFNVHMEGIRMNRINWFEWFPVQERLFDGFNHEEKDAVLLIDIAGGHGHDIAAFKDNFPHVSGRLILQDQPHVLDEISNLHPDIERQAYNFFTPQPVHGARAYFFHFIMHDWDDANCVRILKSTVSAMKPGYSKLLLNEYILPDHGCTLAPALMDIQMMVVLSGMERTKRQWTALLDQAGLEVVEFESPGHGEGIIEAVRKE